MSGTGRRLSAIRRGGHDLIRGHCEAWLHTTPGNQFAVQAACQAASLELERTPTRRDFETKWGPKSVRNHGSRAIH